MSKLSFLKNKYVLFVVGLILGALVIVVIRFFSYSPEHTHYHANFAVYINGKREEFKGSQYYEEVAMCSAYDNIVPAQRAHMHDEVNSVVHVHDHAVTWGQFFDNLGWALGPNFIQDGQKHLYVEDDTNKLHIILNGQNYTDISPMNNVVIKDLDRMLISFGDISNAKLQEEYKTVPNTAHDYDIRQDPASCSGHESPSFSERLHNVF